ncbi:putative WW domain, EF-hand domain pair, WD40/YVTN repeat-like-containing domain superfamily [Plasmopara halstedii]
MIQDTLSPLANEKLGKSLVRQHRLKKFQATLTEVPEAKSPLPEPLSKPTKKISNQNDMPKLLTADDNNEIENADRQKKKQTFEPSAGFLLLRRWMSDASIVEAPSLACRPLSYFFGSLNRAISDKHIPSLTKQTKTRIDVLKAVSKKSHLEVTIECSDELPYGAYSHPQVRVHIVNRCTGRVLCPSQTTQMAKFSTRFGDKAINVFEWQEALNFPFDIVKCFDTGTILLFEVLEIKRRAKNINFCRENRFSTCNDYNEGQECSKPVYRSIAWGFFHAMTDEGTPTIDSFVLPNESVANEKKKMKSSVDTCRLRLRLFQFQPMSCFDKYQAKLQWGWRKDHLTMPAVFLQYQKRSRASAPCTLHIQLRALNVAVSHNQGTKDLSAEANFDLEENHESVKNKSLAAPSEVSISKAATFDAKASGRFNLMAPFVKNTSESCILPHRVLYSLPAGKKGCSAISFSPCGRILAASVNSELGYFVVQVYNLATAELFGTGRGHRGVIYSLEWSIPSKEQSRLLSASSDGTVRLWELPPLAAYSTGSVQNHVLSLVFLWQHFPSFVYCAIFFPRSKGQIVLSGASDGYLRFRIESDIPNGQAEYAEVHVSSAAVHCVCVEAKSERIFCGDSKGDITVWRRIENVSTYSEYQRIKTIQTGQASITSLKLHPRKAHLLVHSQPNAIFQYELRSFLLLNKSYADVVCESLMIKSTFSPDGRFVISGSEDGRPRVYTSLYGQQIQRGVWGTHFYHDGPVLDVSWSPTAHMVALCSYGDCLIISQSSVFHFSLTVCIVGGNSSIVILCADRGDDEAARVDGSALNTMTTTSMNIQLAADAFRETNLLESLRGDRAHRSQRAMKRRQKRLELKLVQEADARKRDGRKSSTLFLSAEEPTQTGFSELFGTSHEATTDVKNHMRESLFHRNDKRILSRLSPSQLEIATLALIFQATGGRVANDDGQTSTWICQTGWDKIIKCSQALEKENRSVCTSTMQQTSSLAYGVMWERNHVVALELSGNGLSGTIPIEIVHLRFLKTLKIRNNPKLRGNLPAEIYAMPCLKYCYLDGTAIQSAFPYKIAHSFQITQYKPDSNSFSGSALATVTFCTGDKQSGTCTYWMADMTESEMHKLHSTVKIFHENTKHQAGRKSIKCTANNATGPERAAAAVKLQRIYRARILRTKLCKFLPSLVDTKIDPISGHTYYVNHRTGEATWDMPTVLVERTDRDQAIDTSKSYFDSFEHNIRTASDGFDNADHRNEPPDFLSRTIKELLERYGAETKNEDWFELFINEFGHDGAGEIHQDDFARICGDLGMALSAKQIQEVFCELDPSNDGHIDRLKVMSWLTKNFK